MKKLLASLLVIGSLSAFADTDLRCKSANYLVLLSIDSSMNIIQANYGIDGWVNDAADVEAEKSYVSDRLIAAQLNVDGQPNKFEIIVSKNSKGIYTGKIFEGKKSQNAKCTVTFDGPIASL